MDPHANNSNLRYGHLQDAALAPTTSTYDLDTFDIRPLRQQQQEHPTIWPPPRYTFPPQQYPTIWPPSRWGQQQQQPTIWSPPRCGPCANKNNNILRSGHLQDITLAPLCQPTIWPPPRCGLCANNSNNLRPGHLRNMALAPAATT